MRRVGRLLRPEDKGFNLLGDGKEIIRRQASHSGKDAGTPLEDRKNYGLVLPKDIQFNVSWRVISTANRMGGVTWQSQDVGGGGRTHLGRLNILPQGGTDQRVEPSGGNQQKVVLAK